MPERPGTTSSSRGVQTAVLVAGQVHHRRHRPIGPEPRRPPDVLVHPQGGDPVQPGRVIDPRGGLDLHRVPQGVPVHPQMAGQRGDSGVIVAQRIGGPADRPGGQLRPRLRHRVGLGERQLRAVPLDAAPDPFAPHHHRRDRAARRVVHPMLAAAVPDRDHPAGRAAADIGLGLDRQHQPLRFADHVQHVHPGDVEQRIGPGAPAHTRTTPTVIHVGVFLRSAASSLPILKAPTPPSPLRHADPRHPPTHA